MEPTFAPNGSLEASGQPLSGLWAASGRPLAAGAGLEAILSFMLDCFWASNSIENEARIGEEFEHHHCRPFWAIWKLLGPVSSKVLGSF